MAVAVHVDTLGGKGTPSAIPPVPSTFPRCGDWPLARPSDGDGKDRNHYIMSCVTIALWEILSIKKLSISSQAVEDVG